MREQKLQLVSADRLYECSFYTNNRIWKPWGTQKYSYEGLNFVCSILPDACSVGITDHPWWLCWWFCCIRIFHFIIIIITIWIIGCGVLKGRYSCITIIIITRFSFCIVWRISNNIIIILQYTANAISFCSLLQSHITVQLFSESVKYSTIPLFRWNVFLFSLSDFVSPRYIFFSFYLENPQSFGFPPNFLHSKPRCCLLFFIIGTNVHKRKNYIGKASYVAWSVCLKAKKR